MIWPGWVFFFAKTKILKKLNTQEYSPGFGGDMPESQIWKVPFKDPPSRESLSGKTTPPATPTNTTNTIPVEEKNALLGIYKSPKTHHSSHTSTLELDLFQQLGVTSNLILVIIYL